MRTKTALALILALLAVPAHAQTVDIPIGNLGSIISNWSSSNTGDPDIFQQHVGGSREQPNPDTTYTDSDSARNTSLDNYSHCPLMKTMNGGWTVRTNVNADCTPLSLNPGGSSRTVVVKGVGSTTLETCTTNTANIGDYNPTTGNVSVTLSSSSRDGAC